MAPWPRFWYRDSYWVAYWVIYWVSYWFIYWVSFWFSYWFSYWVSYWVIYWDINYLREFVKLPSSWPPARVEGESGQQSMTPDCRDPGDPRDPGIVPGGLILSTPHTLSAY